MYKEKLKNYNLFNSKQLSTIGNEQNPPKPQQHHSLVEVCILKLTTLSIFRTWNNVKWQSGNFLKSFKTSCKSHKC